ncbi:lipopolysaccharide biosynthesis protein [Labilibacter sediminis]|nr:lipopolysaccharide biosynthesis protein [Labilibacter sediminis]
MGVNQNNTEVSKVKEMESNIIKGDEIDLIALIKVIWNGRKTMLYSAGIFVFLGLLISFITPDKYSSSVTILPIESIADNQFGGIGALAGMAGINIGGMTEGVASIPAELYPDIVESYPFQKDIINRKFSFKGYKQPISYLDYAKNDTIENLGEKIIKYTIKLPWTIKDYFEKESNVKGGSSSMNLILLNKKELAIFNEFEDIVKVNYNNKTGIVTINAEYEEPLVVAQMVDAAVEILQKYVTEFKTKQVRQNLNFIQERYKEKEAEYTDKQKALFQYRDKHRNLVTERIDFEHQKLSDDYEIVSSVFKKMAQQVEQAKIAVSEKTPSFSIIEPAKIPIEKSGTRKLVVLIIWGILGGIIGLIIVFGKLYFPIYRERWRKL